MNEKFFNINFPLLIRWFLPRRLRMLRMIAWLTVLCRPVVRLYSDFKRFRKDVIYQLTITPQVCYLERMLNDRFDFTLKRIYIDDAIWMQPLYIYQDDELKDEFLYQESEDKPIFLWTDSEAGEDRDDFVVFVPKALMGLVNVGEMTSLLKKYKLAGTHFKIEFI